MSHIPIPRKRKIMNKKQLSSIEWNLLNTTTTTEPCALLKLAAGDLWYLHHSMAFFNEVLQVKRNKTGKASFVETVLDFKDRCQREHVFYPCGRIMPPAAALGLLKFLAFSPRGAILGAAKQSNPQTIRFSSGVPLVLSALKEFRELNYSEWDFSEPAPYIALLAGEDIARCAKLVAHQPKFSASELSEILNTVSKIKSGPQAGKKRTLDKLSYCNSLSGNELFDGLSHYKTSWLKPMILQSWIFQPHLRTRFHITDFNNLDTPATPVRGSLELTESWTW